ncbi:hypothetical protein OA93_04640 [Flavobacterium sp. KMS]|uniref:hypothetical protein n=1 Tax=Flavobacterium sp. KMS TaxID=1566023 RepID=UPI00057EF462|nr:hypothetical protein [Flavobacterium sp. KMS]KIA99458.1 hypothetical protein OA93_04640 [Flavobacterium sp. KMS]
MKIDLSTTRTITLLLFMSSIGYAQVSALPNAPQHEASNQAYQRELSEEYTESKFQGEEEIELTESSSSLGMIKTENGWEAINNKNKVTTVNNNKTIINRKQFIGNYTVKMNIDGMNSTFYADVSIVKGKLKFVVNEGGSINSYYEETSIKEIQKNIQYDFNANDLDSGSSRTYHFKKKGNRFELKFNY